MDHLGAAFGAVLRTRRRAARLCQEELAIIASLDRTFISLLERGLRLPSLKTVIVLASAFGVCAAEIVAEVENRLK